MYRTEGRSQNNVGCWRIAPAGEMLGARSEADWLTAKSNPHPRYPPTLATNKSCMKCSVLLPNCSAVMQWQIQSTKDLARLGRHLTSGNRHFYIFTQQKYGGDVLRLARYHIADHFNRANCWRHFKRHWSRNGKERSSESSREDQLAKSLIFVSRRSLIKNGPDTRRAVAFRSVPVADQTTVTRSVCRSTNTIPARVPHLQRNLPPRRAAVAERETAGTYEI